MTPTDSEGAAHIAQLVDLVNQIVRESEDPAGFDAAAWVAQFLDAPSPALGCRPRDLMGTADGRARVIQLIRQMQSGAYA